MIVYDISSFCEVEVVYSEQLDKQLFKFLYVYVCRMYEFVGMYLEVSVVDEMKSFSLRFRFVVNTDESKVDNLIS